MSKKTPTSIIILIVFLVILLILSIVWIILAKQKLDECTSTESIGCPYYYCPTTQYNNGSPCVDALASEYYDSYQKATVRIPGPNVAFRYDKKGNLQCQQYAMNDNIYSTWTCNTGDCQK